MKTTIKTKSRQIIVQPSPAVPGNVLLMVFPADLNEQDAMAVTLTQDQAGALIFALEQAAEAAQMADRRVAA